MKNNIIKKIVLGIILSVFIFDAVIIALEKTGSGASVVYGADNDTIVLRVCNWEEYIDTGDWDEPIDLESGDIMGVNSMVEDFEIWYHDTYGKNVKVEYSCMGTNEEMYNMLRYRMQFGEAETRTIIAALVISGAKFKKDAE